MRQSLTLTSADKGSTPVHAATPPHNKDLQGGATWQTYSGNKTQGRKEGGEGSMDAQPQGGTGWVEVTEKINLRGPGTAKRGV